MHSHHLVVLTVNNLFNQTKFHQKQTYILSVPTVLNQELLNTRSVNKVIRLIQNNSVLTFKLQIEFVPFKLVPLGGYTPPETLFSLFVATLVVTNRNRF